MFFRSLLRPKSDSLFKSRVVGLHLEMCWELFLPHFIKRSFLPYFGFLISFSTYILLLLNPDKDTKKRQHPAGFVLLSISLLYCAYKLYCEIREIRNMKSNSLRAALNFWNVV